MEDFFKKIRPPPTPKRQMRAPCILYYVIVLYKRFPKNINLTPWSLYHTMPAPLEWIYVIDNFWAQKSRQYANFTYFPFSRPISDVIFGLYAPFYLLEKVF